MTTIDRDQMLVEERLTIGGVLREACSGARFDNTSPSTEQVIGTAADAGAEDMDEAIAAARRAFDETDWSTNHAFRLHCLRQLHEALVRHSDGLRWTTVAEVGAPLSLTYGAQLDTPVAGIEWLIDAVERYEWSRSIGVSNVYSITSDRLVEREAAGVVGAITPWNFPNQINIAKLAPALAAGCTVVLKPAPDTPWTGLALGRIVTEETDIPAGVLNVVTSSEHTIGQVLAEDPRVDMVSFTGSTAVGRRLMAAAAPTIKRVFLELGGKSAAIVLDDADAVMAALGAVFNVTTHAGQGCAITSRLLVPRARRDEIVEQVVALIGNIGYGDPTDPGNMMGPLINARQRERVLGYVATAVEEGATVAVGGGRPAHLPTGYFVEPTVLVGVEPHHTVAQEEIFGPVLSIIEHDGTDDDAVRIANDSIYGLSGAVVSADTDRAVAVARRIRTGTIGVNGALWYSPDAPFGGYKQSGVGREMGIAGFEEYLQTKTIAVPG